MMKTTQNDSMERRTISVLVIMNVFPIVLMLGSSTARLATVSTGHGNTDCYARMKVRDHVDAYFKCYQVFMDNHADAAKSYRSLCLIRDKLNVCKQKVKAASPKVEDCLILGVYGEAEFTAKFWCTHTPDPYIPMYALYYKYWHCPTVYPWFMVLPQEYSAHARLSHSRARFAYTAMKDVNIDRLTRWHPQSNYSNPVNPVYQALSSYYCAFYSDIQYRAQIVDKYCIIGKVYRDLQEQTTQYGHEYVDGLYNWDLSLCPSDPDDPIEKILNVCELETWLNLQVNTSLGQCHARNVAVRGGSCIIIHYTRIPPYVDRHLFMQGFCEPIEKLRQCWEGVLQMCPKQSMNSDTGVLIKLHQLACDLNQQNSSLVWDVIYSWADAVKKVEGSQVTMQALAFRIHNIFNIPLPYTTVFPLQFASALNATLLSQPHITPQIQSLLQELVSHLDRINILETYRFQGLNILHQIYQFNRNIAVTMTMALHGPVELLLTIGGFIDYDPNDFKQWTFFYT